MTINKVVFYLDFIYLIKQTISIFTFFKSLKYQNKMLSINREGWLKSYEIN